MLEAPEGLMEVTVVVTVKAGMTPSPLLFTCLCSGVEVPNLLHSYWSTKFDVITRLHPPAGLITHKTPVWVSVCV